MWLESVSKHPPLMVFDNVPDNIKYEGSRVDDGGMHNKDGIYAGYMKKTKYRNGEREMEKWRARR